MKHFFAILFMVIITISCSNEKKLGNMVVKGEIKGLKKGTLYLQKMKDTSLISVDSVVLFDKSSFILTDNITSPVMYYLTFDGNTTEKKIMFFGEPSEITINDKVEEFGFRPQISGSKNQEVMDKFNEINHKFKMQRLDFIKKDVEARALKDESLVKDLEDEYNRFVKRRVLYTTNFAVSHNDSEAAAYIALSQLFDANVYFLDTINKSLTPNIKASDYGIRLQKFVDDIKKSEKQ